MTSTIRTAACSCGQLSATVSADPVRISVCHCLNCQRRTGGVFASQARFPASAVSITGNSHTYVIVGDEGGRGTFHSCPTCAATVFYTTDGSPDTVCIPIGAFADPSFPAPTVSVYEERKHGWVGIPKDMEHIW